MDDVLVVRIDVVDVVLVVKIDVELDVVVLVVVVLVVVVLVVVVLVMVVVVEKPDNDAISDCDSASLKIAKSSPWPVNVRPHSQKSLPPGLNAVGVSSIGLAVTSTALT